MTKILHGMDGKLKFHPDAADMDLLDPFGAQSSSFEDEVSYARNVSFIDDDLDEGELGTRAIMAKRDGLLQHVKTMGTNM